MKTKSFFPFEIIINVLVRFSASFDYLCYGSTAIINILIIICIYGSYLRYAVCNYSVVMRIWYKRIISGGGVQWLKLPARKVEDSRLELRSGIPVSEKQNYSISAHSQRFNIVGSLSDREVAQGLAQSNLCVHKGDLKPHSFNHSYTR